MATRATNPQSPFRPPIETPIIEKNGQLTWGWIQHLEIQAQQLKTPANQPAPQTNASPVGQHGQFGFDGTNLYIWSGTQNKWLKFAPVAF